MGAASDEMLRRAIRRSPPPPSLPRWGRSNTITVARAYNARNAMTKLILRYVLAGLVLLGVVVAGVSWFQMPAADRAVIVGTIGRVVAVIAIVLVLPWATFFISTAAAKRDSNLAGVALVAGYTVADIALAAWLLGGGWGGTTLAIFGTLGLLSAVLYNVLACDFIADRLAKR